MLKRLAVLFAGLTVSLAAFAGGTQYNLGVKGVACPYCAYGVEKRLNKIEGVDQVEVDIGDSVVRVTMQEGTTLTEEQARKAVEEAGFTLHSFSQGRSK